MKRNHKRGTLINKVECLRQCTKQGAFTQQTCSALHKVQEAVALPGPCVCYGHSRSNINWTRALYSTEQNQILESSPAAPECVNFSGLTVHHSHITVVHYKVCKGVETLAYTKAGLQCFV